ncbi:hypothetical protein Cgig2_029821 [Carnegiea gigantea]|uniref:RING-type E3 ubiquitin transferase n=1 Tax=Carnegiea gigantea TaxID=171969 RepID=A0A9Q1GS17_9CARY|nr:hypothetical protein Cgig2_029821 [Carnegiea gigantea]
MAQIIPMTKELTLLVLSLILSPPFVNAEGGSPSASCAAALIVVPTLMLFLLAAYIRRFGSGCLGAATYGHRDAVVDAAEKWLPAVAVEALPSIQLSEITMRKLGHIELECAVCLIEFKDDDILSLLPDCCHVFHSDCIKPWLASHVTCPVCRANLEKVSGATKSTVLDRISRTLLNPSDHHPTVEIEGSSIPTTSPVCTRGNVRSHSTGELVVHVAEDTTRAMPKETCPKRTMRH